MKAYHMISYCIRSVICHAIRPCVGLRASVAVPWELPSSNGVRKW